MGGCKTRCDDGYTAPSEECDDGNLDFGDGCDCGVTEFGYSCTAGLSSLKPSECTNRVQKYTVAANDRKCITLNQSSVIHAFVEGGTHASATFHVDAPCQPGRCPEPEPELAPNPQITMRDICGTYERPCTTMDST
jgi:cysteine-rich repeat protein